MVKFALIYMAKSKVMTKTDRPKYGSLEYFKELFDDIVGDVQAEEPEIGNNMIAAFKLSLAEWRDYHKKQAEEYERLYFEKE